MTEFHHAAFIVTCVARGTTSATCGRWDVQRCYFSSATSVAATSFAAGTWNWTAPAIATNGVYNVTLTVTDRAGNSANSTGCDSRRCIQWTR